MSVYFSKSPESYYSAEELKAIGFASFGGNVQISRKASVYLPQNIRIGNNVRIDDFAFLSGGGGIVIGDYVHLAVQSCLYGRYGIEIGSFVNLSTRVSVYSVSDDYSGAYMTGPLVNSNCVREVGGKVTIKNHVIVGSGTVILPGVTLEEATAVGAMSLIKKSTEPFSIYAGIPAQKVKNRDKNLKTLEEQYYTTLTPPPGRGKTLRVYAALSFQFFRKEVRVA